MKKKERDLRPYLAAGVTMVLWASSYPGIRAGLHAYSPAHLAVLRYAAASLTLGGYALVRRLRLPGVRDLVKIALLGLMGIAYYGVALNTGELSVPSAEASFLINTAPIFVALVARAWLGERLHRLGWLGMLISFSGVAVIAWSRMTGLLVDAHALLIVSAAFAFSLYVVGQKPLLTRYTAVEFATYAVWTSACCLLVFFPGLPEEMRAAPLPDTFAVIYLGVFPAALGYITWAYALAHLPASRTASFLYLQPLLVLGIAWVWLGEWPSWLALCGGGLVLAGVMVVNAHRQGEASASPLRDRSERLRASRDAGLDG
ncbi:MAG: DMT family transporter, partial [Ktedonobacteraceae bacterium]|nr:DMT family transporter [Ktedonobacteraceae bacterium]